MTDEGHTCAELQDSLEATIMWVRPTLLPLLQCQFLKSTTSFLLLLLLILFNLPSTFNLCLRNLPFPLLDGGFIRSVDR